jgi:iron complex transport system substrate-binding protein
MGMFALGSTASASENTSWNVTVTDDFGTVITIDSVPQRIISLAPSNTEILFALGLGDRIIGVTEYCTYPPEALAIDKVGGYATINIEKVVAAKPDLVVASFGNTDEVIEQIRGLGITVIACNPHEIQDVIDNIGLIGTAAHSEEVAAGLTADLERRIAAVKEKTASIGDRPAVAHVIWNDPLYISGNNTFQNEIITLAGGKNAFAEVERWGVVSLEDFIATNPDVIIVNTGAGMAAESRDVLYDYFMTDERMNRLDAVENGRVYLVESDIIDRGGPRLVDALEEVAADIHPESFSITQTTTAPSATGTASAPVAAVTAVCAVGIALAAAVSGKRR